MPTETDVMYIRARGIVQGPYTRDQLRSLIRRGQFSRIHDVSPDGNNWSSASVLTDLFAPSGQTAARAPTQPTTFQPTTFVPDADVEMMGASSDQSEVAECFVARNNARHGPYTQRELVDWARNGEIL